MKKLFLLLTTALLLASCTSTPVPAPEAPQTSKIIEEVMLSRRSIRQYASTPISRDTLDVIMKMGINAPNGQNRQAYEVRVIDNPALLDEITAAVVKDNPQIAERPGFKGLFYGAPCIVCIATDRTYDISAIDCGLLSENMMLSAWSMGIGSCCLGGPVRMLRDSPSAAPYLEKLNFSPDYDLALIISFGYPAEQPDAKPRKAEKVQYID